MSVADRAPAPHVGRKLRRKEDPRLITGRASYVDDINLVGQLWAAWVRSSEAHAKIVSIDASAARARKGVHAVYTHADLDMEAGLPMAWVPPGVEVNTPTHWVLANDEVKHVGDPVALVIGNDRYDVADAVEDVIVDYDPLPVVVDPEKALEPGSPLVHEQFQTNKVCEWSLGGGDLEAGFAAADVIIERRVVNHRIAGGAIEPRGVLAEYRGGKLTVWSSTQVPHFLRLFLAMLLGMGEDRVRVIAPEVGGAFGSKLQIYAEEIGCAWASRKLGRPVKWIETRSEGMMVTHHGRDQIDTVRVGAKRDGTITAWHTKIVADLGAYQMLLTPMIPPLSAFVMCGVYKTPAVHTDVINVMTNKFPTDAIRGAGRPEATHLIEVTMDQLARELNMDPLELRRKNFIPPFTDGHETPIGVAYDSGNYDAALDKLLEHIDPDQVRREAEELRGRGIYRGIGFSTYTEICGNAPSRIVGPGGFGLQGGGWESATVRVHASGAATVYTGTSPHGQGHETGFAQIVADRLGIDPEQVEVIHGDTQTGPFGLDTYGSRSLAVGGEAAARTANKVATKARAIVAHQLEADPEDIELRDGKFSVRGSPDKGMTLAEVAGAAYVPENLPEGMEPGLDEQTFFDPENFVFPFGAHACVVDVDAETGKVEVVRYVAVDDCGPAINPMLIDGQVHGGITHGLGQALFERVHYNDEGQLVTGTFVDYALPTAAELPSFETDRTETRSPVNSLGVKGVGEAGTIASSAAVTNAVIDALRPLGVDYINMPLSPMRIWEAINQGQGASPEGGPQT
ncbi:MAG: xanthine dehydrogenase family protein molybdopterin-binding subunit [Solirubrobacteraceae bacterium]